jgi:hypothetical protein
VLRKGIETIRVSRWQLLSHSSSFLLMSLLAPRWRHADVRLPSA